jgi:hypothetical protein
MLDPNSLCRSLIFSNMFLPYCAEKTFSFLSRRKGIFRNFGSATLCGSVSIFVQRRLCIGLLVPPFTHRIYICLRGKVRLIPHWPLPAVCNLTRDGTLCGTYDESKLKLSKVSFRGKCARTGNPLKLSFHHQENSPGWVIFLQLAGRAALPARCSILFYTMGIFSLA